MIIQILLALILLVNFHMLGTSRLGALIRAVAWQAFLLILLGLSLKHEILVWHEWILIVITAAAKCLVFPYLLKTALRETVIRREVEPILGYSMSMLLGFIFLAGSVWMVGKLPLPPESNNPFILSSVLFTIMCGFMLIIGRTKAITQVIGYLVLENGIYILSLALAAGNSGFVEMGVLLDVFAGVFIMGIIVQNINREFDHIDTDKLSSLRDS